MKRYTPSYHTLNKTMNGKILKAIDNVMDDYSNRHSKMFAMRLDVHLPEETDQKMIMAFNHRFIEKEKNQGYDPAYVMTREIGKEEGNIHYHMALFLNGQKTESIKPHLDNAWKVLKNIRRAENKEGGKIDPCNRNHRNGIMVKRDDPDSRNLQAVQQQMSYIAKTEQKENVKGKTFFRSQIKKKAINKCFDYYMPTTLVIISSICKSSESTKIDYHMTRLPTSLIILFQAGIF